VATKSAEVRHGCNPINPYYRALFRIHQAFVPMNMVNVSFGGFSGSNAQFVADRRLSLRCLCRQNRHDIGPRAARLFVQGRFDGTVAMTVVLGKAGKPGSAPDPIDGPPPSGSGYRPSDSEAFMNTRQLDYFRNKLLAWKDAILRESADTLITLQNESLREPDVTDRASSETDWSLELRTRDRQRKLIAKIDAAIRRIDEGEYGYCEVTGEPIALARLEARPIATMTVEAQERHERNEKISRDE
jgi:DnaK suppressor protein